MRTLFLPGRFHTCVLSILLLFLAAVSSPAQTSFPEIADPKAVIVTLAHGSGMDYGPSYELIISGSGTVNYEGRGGVFIRGKRTGRISISAMRQLVEEFRRAGFFELQDYYRSSATDLPICITTFQSGPSSKEVVDYGYHGSDPGFPEASRSGAPQSLVDLESRIVELANARRWIKGPWFRRLLHWH